MRLIDADKMLKRIESWNTSDAIDKALYNFTLNRIIEQPTVDADPVRHGRWIKDPHLQVDFPSHFYMMWKCSDCGHSVDNPTPYCPWCGAKMDAERKKKNEIN